MLKNSEDSTVLVNFKEKLDILYFNLDINLEKCR